MLLADLSRARPSCIIFCSGYAMNKLCVIYLKNYILSTIFPSNPAIFLFCVPGQMVLPGKTVGNTKETRKGDTN